MNQCDTDTRAMIIRCLVEGNSMRATARLCGVAINTVVKMQRDLAAACRVREAEMIRGVECDEIQLDEVWTFVGAKKKNCSAAMKREGMGDAWTFVAIAARTKLIICWEVDKRTVETAYDLLNTLRERVKTPRPQITSDGAAFYLCPVHSAFLGEVEYAQLQKIYGSEAAGAGRYSPAQYMGSRKQVICGNPDERKISTSYVERSNLTIRMSNRRFTRLTNGFSKKLEALRDSVALYTFFYNFCRVHMTLGTTPAVAAGIADRVWTAKDLVEMMK